MRNDDSNETTGRSDEKPEKTVNEIPPLASDLKNFAKRLEAFAPRSTRRDRDSLMFAAGQASQSTIGQPPAPASSQMRFWQGATVAMTVVASCLGVVVSLQLTAEPRVIIVQRERPLEMSPVVQRGADSEQTGTEMATTPAIELHEQVLSTAQDRHLADAWNARRKLIDRAGSSDRIALFSESITPTGGDTRVVDPPLTPFSLMGTRSSETIHRLLEKPL